MTKSYRCNICGKDSTQKSHHNTHLESQKHKDKKDLKRMSLEQDGLSMEEVKEEVDRLENCVFDSKVCYIDGEKIKIENFKDKHKDKDLKDKDGNKLIYCCGEKVNAYFRRSNPNPQDMTDWHIEWQKSFEGCTEKSFKAQGQYKARRTDVDLNEKQVIEFQNSSMGREEVDRRKHDYDLYGKEVIWVVNGNEHIKKFQLQNSGFFLLEFENEKWKYESFKSYDYIY